MKDNIIPALVVIAAVFYTFYTNDEIISIDNLKTEINEKVQDTRDSQKKVTSKSKASIKVQTKSSLSQFSLNPRIEQADYSQFFRKDKITGIGESYKSMENAREDALENLAFQIKGTVVGQKSKKTNRHLRIEERGIDNEVYDVVRDKRIDFKVDADIISPEIVEKQIGEKFHVEAYFYPERSIGIYREQVNASAKAIERLIRTYNKESSIPVKQKLLTDLKNMLEDYHRLRETSMILGASDVTVIWLSNNDLNNKSHALQVHWQSINAPKIARLEVEYKSSIKQLTELNVRIQKIYNKHRSSLQRKFDKHHKSIRKLKEEIRETKNDMNSELIETIFDAASQSRSSRSGLIRRRSSAQDRVGDVVDSTNDIKGYQNEISSHEAAISNLEKQLYNAPDVEPLRYEWKVLKETAVGTLNKIKTLGGSTKHLPNIPGFPRPSDFDAYTGSGRRGRSGSGLITR